jgi:hypothetical protein
MTQDKATNVVDDILMPAMTAHADELTPAFVAIYAGNYNAAEMVHLKNLYQTPLGQKVLEKQPGIAAEAAAFGRAWGARVARQALEEHRQELQKRGVTL